ncbi:formyltetrahydrofolate deformylase, partial [Escherichia sp. S69_ASV_4]|nr:formyltetrahydrofolate deformylase [Escherichia sp. S69_ASV_4]
LSSAASDVYKRQGRDVEKNVLSRALYKVLAQRVFVYGNRTIIL